MIPLPGTGEMLLIGLLVAIVFFGEKVGAIGDAIGRLREPRGAKASDEPTVPSPGGVDAPR